MNDSSKNLFKFGNSKHLSTVLKVTSVDIIGKFAIKYNI
ncbi:hypothetical protein EV196_10190 [Mariniflexile fucanivorans]|uniref:Uncharacterized protein n=1 Tax=Mariniflexile fucanivorans TaxID=264023 RepID=A0A4R1RQI3_9FLAO|nr:hypothetical protein EV196_10190 [Mariniflexile fucanivorans]